MSILEEISQNLQDGKAKTVKELVQKAVDDGMNAETILNEGLLKGMDILGGKFKRDEVYVPDVLIAARAMKAGTEILKPILAAKGVQAVGKVVLGTVSGDMHDIGKNLVRMMMEGKGLNVIDIGVDATAEMFVQTAIDEKADIIACSALLTTTMSEMEHVVEAAIKANIRDSITIMIGGAPITDSYCKKIGADFYSPDAASAAEVAYSVCVK
jgi:methylmalonyl-CoA mutase cobalamin-binding domain/chain